MSTNRKEDIYVITSGSKVLHAVKTKRQADRFIHDWQENATQLCNLNPESNIIWDDLKAQKTKLIYPRTLSEKQLNTVKEMLKPHEKDSQRS